MMIQAPIFGSRHYNNKIKIGLAALISLVAIPNLPMPDYFPEDTLGFIMAIISQIVVGLAIGFTSFAVMAVAQFGGEILDIQMGLSVAATIDPSTGGTSKIIQRLTFYMTMLFWLVVDGHHQLFRVLFMSYEVVPLTYVHLSGDLAILFINITGDLFRLGIQLAAPSLAALFITQVALGLLARVAPQMNVFMLSFPLNISIGMLLLALSFPKVQQLLLTLFEENLDQLVETLQYLVSG